MKWTQPIFQGFSAAYHIAWLDCAPRKLQENPMNTYAWAESFLWGFGSVVGALVAVVVVLGRIVTNAVKTGAHVFMDMVNAVLLDKDRIESWGLAEKEVQAGVVGSEDGIKKRAYQIQTYWLGGIGGLIGLVLGFIVGTIGVGFFYHTYLNAKRAFYWGFDSVEKEGLFGKDERSMLQKGVGILGTLIGGVLGLLSWVLVRILS